MVVKATDLRTAFSDSRNVMSNKFVISVILNVALIGLIVGQEIKKRTPSSPAEIASSAQNRPETGPSPEGPCPGSGICGTNAFTLLERVDIVGDGQFHPTGFNLQVYKTQKNSYLFYTSQITFQFDIPQSVGAHFKMRVKDSSGKYIMPDMTTGSVSRAANSLENAMLSDTVYHTGTKFDPPPGLYTFELWALGGAGKLTIVPFMSNIAVLELPRQL